MHAIEFERKLKELNPRLYLSRKINWDYNKELGTVGIYYRDYKEGEDIELRELTGEEYNTAKRINESPDCYVGFCTFKHVPEGNQFDLKGHIKSPGWREILIRLSQPNSIRPSLIDLQKARKVFKSDVGTSTYDTLPVEAKFRRQFPNTRQRKFS